MNNVSLWNWPAGDPVPEAKLVVAWPGFFENAGADACNAHLRRTNRDAYFVFTGTWTAEDCPPSGLIPALHASAQADLEGRVCPVCAPHGMSNDPSYTHICGNCNRTGRIGGLRALMAVQAERRALVLSPKEAIDLRRALDAQAPHPLGGGLIKPGADLVIVTGFDEPIHPVHVLSIVVQCRMVHVPVVLLWGEWAPHNHGGGFMKQHVEDYDVDRREVDGEMFYRVGAARSGSMLDGERYDVLPDWMGGGA